MSIGPLDTTAVSQAQPHATPLNGADGVNPPPPPTPQAVGAHGDTVSISEQGRHMAEQMGKENPQDGRMAAMGPLAAAANGQPAGQSSVDFAEGPGQRSVDGPGSTGEAGEVGAQSNGQRPASVNDAGGGEQAGQQQGQQGDQQKGESADGKSEGKSEGKSDDKSGQQAGETDKEATVDELQDTESNIRSKKQELQQAKTGFATSEDEREQQVKQIKQEINDLEKTKQELQSDLSS